MTVEVLHPKERKSWIDLKAITQILKILGVEKHMCVYTCVHTYVHMNVHVCTCMCARACVHMHAYIHTLFKWVHKWAEKQWELLAQQLGKCIVEAVCTHYVSYKQVLIPQGPGHQTQSLKPKDVSPKRSYLYGNANSKDFWLSESWDDLHW